MSARVECINRTNRTDPHERIHNIGGIENGTLWKHAESEAIGGMEVGRWTFQVERPAGHIVRVIIATRLGRKYLKTETDGEEPDNLLALPECP